MNSPLCNFKIISLEFGLIFICLLFLTYLYLKKLRRRSGFYSTVPHVPGRPIIGNAWEIRNPIIFITTAAKFLKEHGDTFVIKVGPFRKLIVTTDCKLVEAVLSSIKILTKSEDYLRMNSWLGTGLLTSDGDKWKKHRRMLTPAFHFQILEVFIGVFNSCGNVLIDKLEKICDHPSVDVYPLVTLYALDLICESTMGISVNAQMNENSEYVRSVKAMGHILMQRNLSPIKMYDLFYPLTMDYYREKKALKILHNQTNSVIEARKQLLLNNNSQTKSEENEFFKVKKPFLDLLLECTKDGRPLTYEEIREEVDTFMFEGHDTSSSAIAFTLYCLANHKDVQINALEEQQKIFFDRIDKTATYTDLQNMKYLELVIKESLRLFPSVPIFGRKTTSDVEFNGFPLPDGDTLMIYSYGIHRNPKYFSKPDEFNPGRPELVNGKLPFAYIPFSAGPRNCIGQKFAMLSIKCIISKILLKFELKPAIPNTDLILASELILKSANGIRIRLQLRN